MHQTYGVIWAFVSKQLQDTPPLSEDRSPSNSVVNIACSVGIGAFIPVWWHFRPRIVFGHDLRAVVHAVGQRGRSRLRARDVDDGFL